MEIIKGLSYNFRGLALGLKTPSLLFLGFLRFFIVLGLTLLLSGLILFWHHEILSAIWEMPDQGFLLYVWKIVSWVLSIVLASVAVVISYFLAQIFFCVFIMDYMSRITEKMLTGAVQNSPTSWFSFFWYLVKQEIPRAIIPVMLSLILLVLGLLTPFSLIVLVFSSLIAAIFLSWDNTDLVPARRMFPFKERFGFLKKHLGFHIGFGLCFLIPWLNILFLSFAPVGATMYYIDMEKHRL